MTTQVVGINPKVLQWARERARYSLEDVARKFNKDVEFIEKWESGEEFPTYKQLEKLAYKIYKRPLALFFFPEPPSEPDEHQEFRTLPDFEINKLDADAVYALRIAKAMQISLKEITDDVNPSERKIFQDIRLSTTDNLREVAQDIRKYLNVPLSDQKAWDDDDCALKTWRNKVEEVGVFIFKRSFKQRDISGFCLIDSEFPLIYLNNSTAKVRQIFTIFHELAHILLSVNGITKIDDEYINLLQGDSKNIEIFCNQFAAEFLVPSSDFMELSKADKIDDAFILNIAREYKVSREVVLRRLFEFDFIKQNNYDKMLLRWNQEYSNKEKNSGGDYYRTETAYLGENYLKLVFNKYYQGKYDIEQVADHLNLSKIETVEKLEQYLLKRNVI